MSPPESVPQPGSWSSWQVLWPEHSCCGSPVAERFLVVVPTYNERVNLPLVVPAILSQDPRFEVLVVDDNSPDGTGQLADELAASTPRIHVMHRPGKSGLGKAYRSEEHTSELQSRRDLVCRLLLEKKKRTKRPRHRPRAAKSRSEAGVERRL